MPFPVVNNTPEKNSKKKKKSTNTVRRIQTFSSQKKTNYKLAL